MLKGFLPPFSSYFSILWDKSRITGFGIDANRRSDSFANILLNKVSDTQICQMRQLPDENVYPFFVLIMYSTTNSIIRASLYRELSDLRIGAGVNDLLFPFYNA